MKGTHKVFFIFDFKIFRSSIINKGWFILRVPLYNIYMAEADFFVLMLFFPRIGVCFP